MDEETRKKIDDLARNLKELHLSATIEEARQRADEIISSTIKTIKNDERSIKEMLDEKTADNVKDTKEDAKEDEPQTTEQSDKNTK
ncbi:hypothetical protein DRJ25_00435 [Candidatus Woesearchaeota archaeon]|nr:MAG: hypothetical protein DRJ25_00435 [Candidatus Woesearchaeota archaeon]